LEDGVPVRLAFIRVEPFATSTHLDVGPGHGPPIRTMYKRLALKRAGTIIEEKLAELVRT
ncbi:MAG: hypothetical protein ACREBZ_05230, partial [Thermoplasmata archaeon]